MTAGALTGACHEQRASVRTSHRRAVPVEDAKEIHSGVGIEFGLLDGCNDFRDTMTGEQVQRTAVAKVRIDAGQPLSRR